MTSQSGGALRAPETLTLEHDVSGFNCGEKVLDEWLRKRALANQKSGASRTYVLSIGKKVIAYYALAVGAVAHNVAPGRVRRNRPDPVPVMVLARLAIDSQHQGRGLGAALLRDAILRTLQAGNIAGIRAILVHAISESARKFYERFGFHAAPIDPMTLMITVEEAKQALGDERRF
jgi:GNAT superfamily N-acetyltransferase